MCEEEAHLLDQASTHALTDLQSDSRNISPRDPGKVSWQVLQEAVFSTLADLRGVPTVAGRCHARNRLCSMSGWRQVEDG